MKNYDRRDIEELKGQEENNEEVISVRRTLLALAFVLLIVLSMQV